MSSFIAADTGGHKFFSERVGESFLVSFFFQFTALRAAFSFCDFVLEERLIMLDNEEQFCELLLGG